MKSFSKQRFGLMGKFHNELTDLIDASQLTPAEILVVLNSNSTYIMNLVLSLSNATRRKSSGNNVEKDSLR